MATKPDTDMRDTWERMFAHLTEVTASLNQVSGQARSAKQDQLCAIQSNLITLPSPHLAGVIEKLALLFECQMEGNDEEAVAKRTILSDLCRLHAEGLELAGPALRLIAN